MPWRSTGWPRSTGSGACTPDDRAEAAALLQVAREAVRAAAAGRPLPAAPASGRRAGAFVTLLAHGGLRGCIGRLEADRPLAEVVRDMAAAAATEDPRFPPLMPDEVDGIVVEVSVLSPLEPARAEAVVPGRDGVVLRVGGRQAVFLPKVAAEHGWDRETLLGELCRKAGLATEAWRSAGADIRTFRAQVIVSDDA